MANPWATPVQAADIWPASDRIDADRLAWLLDVAYEVLVEGPAPALVALAPVPLRYTEAVVLHAREVYAAAQRDGDLVGFDAYAVRARPVTASVVALLRPPGRPVVG